LSLHLTPLTSLYFFYITFFFLLFFFFNDTATTEIYTLSLHDALPILVARLRSSVVPDPSKALLLVAHLDVVPVDKARWTVDPFSGAIRDGYMYGRGAIDDKGMLAANLAVFIHLKRTNAHLNRDVIFLATADEEGSGDASI